MKSTQDILSQATDKQLILASACYTNQLNKVKDLIENKKMNPNIPTINGWYPIHYAVYEENFEIFKYLVEIGADINVVTTENQSIFHLAASVDEIDVVEFIVNSEKFRRLMKINLKDLDGSNELLYACEYNAIEVLNILLKNPDIKKNYSFKEKDNTGENIFSIVCRKGHLEILKLLYSLENIELEMNIIDTNNKTPFIHAVSNNHREVIDYLLYEANYKIDSYSLEYLAQNKDKYKDIFEKVTKKELYSFLNENLDNKLIEKKHKI